MNYNNWEHFLEENGNHCVVYGAGIVARIFADAIFFTEEQKYNVDFFAVSGKPEVSEYYFIPVKTFDKNEIDFNTPIVIATRENVQEEILLNLTELGYNNVYTLKWTEFIKLQRDSTRTALGELSEFRREFKLFLEEKRISEGDYLNTYMDNMLYYNDFNQLSQDDQLLYKSVENLISGLDDKSKSIIYQVIDRLHKLILNHKIIYTQEEKDRLVEIKNIFNNRIYKISESKFVYDNYYLPIKGFESTVFLYQHGMKEISNIDYIKDKDFIDAGGFIGDSALVLSEYTKGNIHSFEADKSNYLTIKKTIKMNNKTNIIPVNSALSDFVGDIDLFVIGDNSSGNSTNNLYNMDNLEKQKVECTTIDDYVSKNNLQIGLIKTDVEGAEQALLRGAINTIKTQKPILSISIYHTIDDFFKIKSWIESLDLGYKFTISKPVIAYSFLGETALICEIDKNVL